MKITDDRAKDLLFWLDDMAGDHVLPLHEMARYRDAAALICQLRDDEQSAWHAGLDAGREQGKGNEHCQAEPQPQPVAWQFQDRDGRWHGFMDEQHRQNTIADGSWPMRALYAAPPSVPEAHAQGGSDNDR